MKELPYKKFSRLTHEKNIYLDRLNSCQFELTFGCNFACVYCFNSCYNYPTYLTKELNTVQIKLILDKLHQAGIIWLCFTGGDPLTRPDFLDIYSYAKEKGFIISVFTNGYSVTEKIIDCFKSKPPFVIEITLNAVSESLFEKISRVNGSFKKVISAIGKILKNEIPLNIKTQVTRDNLREAPKIAEFLKARRLKFNPDFKLYPKLDGDLSPCALRIKPMEALKLYGMPLKPKLRNTILPDLNKYTPYLYPCAIDAGDGIKVDPYGNIFLCALLREPKLNLLETDVCVAREKLLSLVRGKTFTTRSRCANCRLKDYCHWCPGMAYLEKKDREKPIEYYCELAELTSRA